MNREVVIDGVASEPFLQLLKHKNNEVVLMGMLKEFKEFAMRGNVV